MCGDALRSAVAPHILLIPVFSSQMSTRVDMFCIESYHNYAVLKILCANVEYLNTDASCQWFQQNAEKRSAICRRAVVHMSKLLEACPYNQASDTE